MAKQVRPLKSLVHAVFVLIMGPVPIIHPGFVLEMPHQSNAVVGGLGRPLWEKGPTK